MVMSVVVVVTLVHTSEICLPGGGSLRVEYTLTWRMSSEALVGLRVSWADAAAAAAWAQMEAELPAAPDGAEWVLSDNWVAGPDPWRVVAIKRAP